MMTVIMCMLQLEITLVWSSLIVYWRGGVDSLIIFMISGI